jgi:glutathione S-transferase
MRLYAGKKSGNSFKPALVVHQLGLPVEITVLDIVKGETRTAEYLALNPRGTTPFLAAGSHGFTESNAISWYLAEASRLALSTAESRAVALQWMFFEQTALEPYISPARFYQTIAPQLAEEHATSFPSWHVKGMRGLKVLDTHLKSVQFIADNRYTVGDICVFGYVHLAEEGGFDLKPFDAVRRWISRIEDQDGYRPISDLIGR